jgi:hypothetical protein
MIENEKRIKIIKEKIEKWKKENYDVNDLEIKVNEELIKIKQVEEQKIKKQPVLQTPPYISQQPSKSSPILVIVIIIMILISVIGTGIALFYISSENQRINKDPTSNIPFNSNDDPYFDPNTQNETNDEIIKNPSWDSSILGYWDLNYMSFSEEIYDQLDNFLRYNFYSNGTYQVSYSGVDSYYGYWFTEYGILYISYEEQIGNKTPPYYYSEYTPYNYEINTLKDQLTLSFIDLEFEYSMIFDRV